MSTIPDLPALAAFARRHAPDALFVTVSGSHLYGFPSADSDIDLRGCHQLPLRALLGLRPPEPTREIKGGVGGLEVEQVSHEVGKYLGLLCRHNGYVLEQVFSPLVVLGGDFLERLRPLARRCVTRGCHHHYRGFLHGRLKQMEKEQPPTAKSLLYAYRVVLTGIHLLRSGEVLPDLPELARRFDLPFLPELIRRKQERERGTLSDVDSAWHREQLARLEAQLDEAHAASSLPEAPPWAEMDRFLIELRLAELSATSPPPPAPS
jgi:predicted nucleotidyltransferase